MNLIDNSSDRFGDEGSATKFRGSPFVTTPVRRYKAHVTATVPATRLLCLVRLLGLPENPLAGQIRSV